MKKKKKKKKMKNGGERGKIDEREGGGENVFPFWTRNREKMLYLPVQRWERGEFGIHGYLAAASTWWDPFWIICSDPCPTCHRRRWLEKQRGTPGGPAEAGMLRKLGGSVGGSRSPNLKVTSHHFIMFPVSEKKKKKLPWEGGQSPTFYPRRGPPPP